MPTANTQLEIEQRCRAGEAGKRCLFTFVAVSGDNAIDEQRLTAMPDNRAGTAGGGRRE